MPRLRSSDYLLLATPVVIVLGLFANYDDIDAWLMGLTGNSEATSPAPGSEGQ